MSRASSPGISFSGISLNLDKNTAEHNLLHGFLLLLRTSEKVVLERRVTFLDTFPVIVQWKNVYTLVGSSPRFKFPWAQRLFWSRITLIFATRARFFWHNKISMSFRTYVCRLALPGRAKTHPNTTCYMFFFFRNFIKRSLILFPADCAVAVV